MKPLITAAALLVAALALTGCSSFHREWKSTVTQAGRPGEITGPWEGTWQSEANGHHGGLRAIITETEPGLYRARFHASYKRVLRFGYTAQLQGRPERDGVKFDGESDLGKLAGGIYTYDGFATPEEFFATYRSSKDHGTFKMRRPEGWR